MSSHIVVVEKRSDFRWTGCDVTVVTAHEFILGSTPGPGLRKVTNLCRGYAYMSLGYYVSLLAEARGDRVTPSVETIIDLQQKAVVGPRLSALTKAAKAARANKKPFDTEFRVTTPAGRHQSLRANATVLADAAGNPHVWLASHVSIFHTESDKADGIPAIQLKEALDTGLFHEYAIRVRKDGSRFMAAASLAPLYNAEGAHIGFSKVVADITPRLDAE